MVYCTKCRTLSPDSARACRNCHRTRGLRPVRDEDEVFFLKVSEAEAAELEQLFAEQAVRCRTQTVKGGLSAGVFDPEYMPTDRELYVAWGDLSRANELLAKEAEAQSPQPAAEEGGTSRKKRMAVQTVSILAFMLLVMLTVFCADAVANWVRGLFG